MNTLMIIIFVAVMLGILYLGYKQITKKGIKGSGGATGGNGDTENEDDSPRIPKPKKEE